MQKAATTILILLFFGCVFVILYVTGIFKPFEKKTEEIPTNSSSTVINNYNSLYIPFNPQDTSVKKLTVHASMEGKVIDSINRAGITEMTFINLDSKEKVMTLPLGSMTKVILIDGSGIEQEGIRAQVVPGKKVDIEADYDYKTKGWVVTRVIVY